MSTQQIVEGNKVIAWWSGGITSAVTCKLCIDWYGVENVRVVFIDTKNEDEDTYRFKSDCEKWYGKQIEVITNEKYSSIEEVWFKFLSLNVATGAICST
jgi:3'-phosphoadenosine 5'-phosphosulfate sulfotransferase (PAPS reductase)/FAD synthetase